MIVLDTTALVYAVGDDHPLRRACQDLLVLVGDGRRRATTTIEVIHEFAHVRSRRRSRSDAVHYARRFAQAFAPLIVLDEADLQVGLDLFERHERLGAFDSLLAGVTLRRGFDGIVSADRAFADVDGLTYFDPAADGFVESLTNTG